MDGVVAVLAPVVDGLDDFVRSFSPARVLADRQAPLGEFLVGLVLVGENAGSKAAKAEELGRPILNEEQFVQLLEGGPDALA